jgi:hypothetical protein
VGLTRRILDRSDRRTGCYAAAAAAERTGGRSIKGFVLSLVWLAPVWLSGGMSLARGDRRG